MSRRLKSVLATLGSAVLTWLLLPSAAAGALDTPERVADINPGPIGSNPGGTTSVGRNVLFQATEPGAGSELWRSDGSEQGTELVADVIPGAVGAAPSPAVLLGNTLLMILHEPSGGDEPWRSDGTASGTARLADINPGAASANPRGFIALDSDTALFRAEDPVNGIELWRTDGTSAGTELVFDVNPGAANGLGGFFFPEVRAGVAYFRASEPVTGSELWRSDGSAAGTELVANINLVGGSAPLEITAAGDWIYLLAEEGATGRELWRSDGEPGGTYELVEDFDGAATDSGVTGLTAFGGRVYFRAPDGGNGVELMRSAGPGMTELVADINPVGDSNPQNLTPLGPWLYFTAVSGGFGRELWRSDGVPGGTTEMVADINPAGSSPCAFPWLTPFGGRLYLCANDGTSGNELWRSDGSAAGTERVADINAGAAGSAPTELTPHGDALYFQADDGVSGPELWALDLRPPDTIVVGAPGDGVHVADSTPPLALASQAIDLARFECAAGSAAFTQCAGRDGAGSAGPLADGEQTLLIRAVDVRDNADPTPEARTFTVDTTPPELAIARRKLTINRRGIAKLKLGCAASELTGPCSGKLKLKTRRRVGNGKRQRRLKLAKASFEVEPGEQLRLKLPVKAAKLELLAGDRRARRLVAKVTAADALGNSGAHKRRLRARLRGL